MLGVLIIGYVFKFIFSNVVPMLGNTLGIETLGVNILGTNSAWIGVLIVTVWQSLAFNTLIYLSGLQTVDKDLYEAADLDGATGLSRFFMLMYYYFISAMFIPFNVLMLPLVKQANLFHMDNVIGITFLYIVFGLPMNTFLYTGFIKSVPEALDEAAIIDGANPWQVFTRVIFPIMKPMHATVAILSIMWTWNDFTMPLVLLSEKNIRHCSCHNMFFKDNSTLSITWRLHPIC